MGDTVLCTRNGGKDSVSIVVDSVRRWGMTAPKPAVTVYPNPVVRGGMVRLAWSGEAGTYSVAFLGLHRQMTAERVIVVGEFVSWRVWKWIQNARQCGPEAGRQH
jgi:hypothetical protein